jgi:hypothetical protein
MPWRILPPIPGFNAPRNSRLEKLLEDLSARKLNRLEEPGRCDRFGLTIGQQISSILVQKVD